MSEKQRNLMKQAYEAHTFHAAINGWMLHASVHGNQARSLVAQGLLEAKPKNEVHKLVGWRETISTAPIYRITEAGMTWWKEHSDE